MRKDIRQSDDFIKKKRNRVVFRSILGILFILSLLYFVYFFRDYFYSKFQERTSPGLTSLPVAILCSDLPNFDEANASDRYNNCKYMDGSRNILNKVGDNNPRSLAVLYSPSASSTPDSNTIMDFMKVITKFENSQYIFLGMLIKNTREYEMYFRSDVGEAGDIVIVNVNNKNIYDDIDSLDSFLENMIDKKDIKSITDFDYIDMRYLPNIFYKLSNSERQKI